MQKNIINVVNKVYKFLIAGMYFWWYIIKGLIVYGLIPAMCCLLKATDELFVDAEDRPVGIMYKETYQGVKDYKVHSFIVFLYHSFVFAGIYMVNQYEGPLASVFLVLMIYLFVMGLILTTYTTYFITFKSMDFKNAFIHSFVSSLKNPIASIAILGIIFISAWIGYMNLVAMIFVVPALYAIVVKWLFVGRI